MYKLLLIILFVCLYLNCFSQDSNDVSFRTEEISFSAGKFFIKGNLLTPLKGENFPVVLFCTGSGPTNMQQTIKMSKVLRRFIKSGFAFFLDDKPGSGESTGEFSGDSLFQERAMILTREIEILKLHPLINPKQIGLYGSSQAGYVMPLVLENSQDVAFMIAWSCPAMSSVEQSAYLVKMQSICNGDSKEDAEKLWKYYKQRVDARTYREYFEAAEYLDSHSVIKDLGWGGVYPEKDFEPVNKNSSSFFNPIGVMEKVKVPVLAIFGEKDTQVDPAQGADGYRVALQKAGNKFYKIVTIPNADHNMRITKTGSLREQKENYNKEEGAKLAPEFLEIIDSWLGELKVHFEKKWKK
jgi:uncharacterized protein